MILKRKKYKDLDFINDNSARNKPVLKPSRKIADLINRIDPPPEIKRTEFKRPTTNQEYLAFHKTNEDGIKQAYATKEGLYQEGNRLYIAGTRDFQDVMDWAKIATNTFEGSKIYKNADAYLKTHPEVTELAGHSAGGSAALELEKNYADRKYTTMTYNAPVFEPIFNAESFLDKSKTPLRFSIVGDPVSMFDMNSQATFRAPDINLDFVKNTVEAVSNPSIDSIEKAIKSVGGFDPLFGFHSISSASYSNPSTASDFVESAVKAGAAASAIGII
jgi:hypothetical protein